MHYHTLITFSTGVCQRALLFLSFSHTHMHTHLHYPLLCLCKCEHISLFNTLLLIPSFFIAFQHHQGEFQVFFRTLQSLLCIIRSRTTSHATEVSVFWFHAAADYCAAVLWRVWAVFIAAPWSSGRALVNYAPFLEGSRGNAVLISHCHDSLTSVL